MSLLGSQVYANADKNIWLPATGGVITGSLIVEGSIEAKAGPIQTQNFVAVNGYDIVDGNDVSTAALRAPSTNLFIQAQNSISFGKLGEGSTNTNLTISAPGSGLDLFTTNFLRAIGPIPTDIISSPKTINPVPTTPAESFIVDTPFPTVSGAIYDVQATGIITLASGASDPDDAIILALDAGTGTSITTYTFYPEANGSSGNWSIRQRIVANAVQPSLLVSASQKLAGVSTGVYSATMNYFSVVRVA